MWARSDLNVYQRLLGKETSSTQKGNIQPRVRVCTRMRREVSVLSICLGVRLLMNHTLEDVLVVFWNTQIAHNVQRSSVPCQEREDTYLLQGGQPCPFQGGRHWVWTD